VAGPERTPVDVVAFFDDVAALMLAADPRLELLGSHTDATTHFREAAATPHRRVWNMQNRVSQRANREGLPLNDRSRAQGAELRLVVPADQLAQFPLLTTIQPSLRVGAVPKPLLLLDTLAFFAGPLGTPLAHTLWRTVDPGLVARAEAAYLAVWEAAVPAEDVGGLPPLPERTRHVAFLLVEGATDKEIAAELGVSERTVSGEVRAVVRWVGARSRGHAIALLVGAGR
jgi:DNA-binding CsgD family transcriptional regulator